MRIHGKPVDIEKAKTLGWQYAVWDDVPSLTMYFDHDGETVMGDSRGLNAYSVVLNIENGRIFRIDRYGHLFMHAGQGYDEELSRFPKYAYQQYKEAMEKLIG